ncbi:MAG TPA: hypothetical protein VEZ42_14095 [Pseudonocardia sp.]|nr:hypothetical protein [Pseudonocardia sp.]
MTGFRFLTRAWVVLLTAAAIGSAGAVVAPAAASAQAPPWGACGRSTADDKVVRTFAVNHRLTYTLRCGNEAGGYRHILIRHKGDYERLAAGTFQNWRDIADLSMETIARDPDVALPARNGKACLSRVMFFHNLRTNQLVRQQIFRMIVVVATGDIVTLTPHSEHCER